VTADLHAGRPGVGPAHPFYDQPRATIMARQRKARAWPVGDWQAILDRCDRVAAGTAGWRTEPGAEGQPEPEAADERSPAGLLDRMEHEGVLAAAWRAVWRVGLAPELTVPQLRAILAGLQEDDRAMLQEDVAQPAPGPGKGRAICTGASVIGYGFWRAGGRVASVAQVDRFDRQVCRAANQRLGRRDAVGRYFWAWYGTRPGAVVNVELGQEVRQTLAERGVGDRRAG
jgi:hypothetical protein